MAKKIELGLSLKGADARRFHEYMEHPDDTKEGRELLKEALRLSKRSRTSSEV
ncbi:hypothetical protein [Methanoplanus limicola]|uniref:Uncharacterized protein n=1 Tax=Methanoplanus limicola DSM 2279 TaxID=937775 RepID=H1Z2K5_9EURY|nr:hypothetical protein [Methanoplanus limicola]EHQ35531.1 hypothetical protein Metlim_1428 [Methanoplanus limicola DSM 2279]